MKEKRGSPLPIPSLQIPIGEKFIGSAATAKPLDAKHVYTPAAFNMHQDGGNTGTTDYPGPLGKNLEPTTALESLHIMMWTRSGQQNLWFSSGGLRAQGGHGDAQQNTSTFGYIEPDGTVYVQHFENQMVENGTAINGTTVFAVTGPSGDASGANAQGYFYVFGPGEGNSITTLWSIPCDAGDVQKLGSYARGSGATPALLGDQYVAITDNAMGQVNLVIYHQEKQTDGPQTVCKVPIFQPGKSNIDIAPLAHHQGGTYGVFLCNDYNAPPLYYVDSGLNGDFNNLTQMEPGIIKINSVPVLSTKSGLVYGYTQAVELTKYGQYTWYVVAVDWETGKEVWRLRTGTGGTFNDDYQPGAIGPDGSFYQGVIGGVQKDHGK
ncbi:hypothetical protein ATEIFO6365_0009025900 [Aspergillus terreus]|uniref:Uncharacterized protein n=1 Tax=Aspergillus terreus TaxID=33178 RepID=A0A5M3Z7X6_ASPTE|nr:hypothetical protein ATETN484_0011025900 [Aspergillus terreus]GFF18896.1 hypothetical protein ATEIFO6365_0009025900 [Aspergillus terreus]